MEYIITMFTKLNIRNVKQDAIATAGGGRGEC